MNKNSHSKAAVIKNWGYLLYALPGTVGLLFFYVSPFTTILHYSFTESNVLGSFAGFECYLQVLRNAAFRLAFKNTAFLAFFGTLTLVFAGLILALLLDRVIRKTAVVLTAFLILPVAFPSACTALLLQFFAPGIPTQQEELTGKGRFYVVYKNHDTVKKTVS